MTLMPTTAHVTSEPAATRAPSVPGGRRAPLRLASAPGLIRVAVLDDHSATRAGVEAIIFGATDVQFVGAAASEAELWPLLTLTRPDVLILDVWHPGVNGLSLCLRLDRMLQAPRTILYSGSKEPELTFSATIASAAAAVSKSDSAHALLTTIREVAYETYAPRSVPACVQRQAAAKLGSEDRAIFAMRLAHTPTYDIAATLHMPVATVGGRLVAIAAAILP